MQKQGRPVNTNFQGRAIHELQQDAEAIWDNTNADEYQNINAVTTTQLSFNSVWSVVITRLKISSR